MAVNLEYNPSTGKVHFTAATKKLQIVGEVVQPTCPQCTPTPETLLVTLTGITSAVAGCTECDFADSKDRSWSSGIPDINDQYTLIPDGINTCRWLYTEDASFAENIYESTDGTCTTLETAWTFDYWYITVRYVAPWWVITVGAHRVEDDFLFTFFRTLYNFLGFDCAYITETTLDPTFETTFACNPFYSPTGDATFEVEEVI